MDIDRLRKHLKAYLQHVQERTTKEGQDAAQRQERAHYYQAWTADRIRTMSEDDFYEYVSKLWAMLIWGNKKYVVNKLIKGHGLAKLTEELVALVWGGEAVEERWDRFRSRIKGMGPAMMSEILCHTHPTECMLWNRRAYAGLRYLGVEDLPRYNYQLTGKKYQELSGIAKRIAREMQALGVADPNLLAVDYFIWEELQFDENLSQIHEKTTAQETTPEVVDADTATSEFIHNEVRDKLADIGQWLGFNSQTEIRVAEGSRADTVWEATIGNMGRVVYVFEVQTKGSIDSLILNLLKSLNNPAVQGVVAVSDAGQIEKIRNHAAGVSGLREKLKYWNYQEVLKVHEALESVSEAINSLGLVPQGF